MISLLLIFLLDNLNIKIKGKRLSSILCYPQTRHDLLRCDYERNGTTALLLSADPANSSSYAVLASGLVAVADGKTYTFPDTATLPEGTWQPGCCVLQLQQFVTRSTTPPRGYLVSMAIPHPQTSVRLV
jgi:hypothetical protein